MEKKKRVQSAAFSTLLSLCFACGALSPMFSGRMRLGEFEMDAIGIASCIFAVFASYLLYPLRSQIGFRICATITILLAIAIGFEFIGGLLWLTLDKMARYEQRPR